jgi:predicted transcriptional regulator
MSEEDPITRDRVLSVIKETPGIHFREIARRLDLPMGAVEYHIHQLLKRDLIVARSEGRYKRYYAEGRHGSEEKRLLSYLRKTVPRSILISLMLKPGSRHRDMKEALSLTGSTLTFHLQRLVTDGVVIEKDDGGTKRFYVADPKGISASLIKYKSSFMDDLVESFADTWLQM